jgi:hypothetical protein
MQLASSYLRLLKQFHFSLGLPPRLNDRRDFHAGALYFHFRTPSMPGNPGFDSISYIAGFRHRLGKSEADLLP